MDVLTSFIADGETAEAVEPRQCALNHPAVASQVLTDVHTAAGNPGCNGALTAFRAAATMIVGFVGMQFIRPAPWEARSMPHGRDCIKSGGEHEAVVPVGAA
jgi:hypothetical protein